METTWGRNVEPRFWSIWDPQRSVNVFHHFNYVGLPRLYTPSSFLTEPRLLTKIPRFPDFAHQDPIFPRFQTSTALFPRFCRSRFHISHIVGMLSTFRVLPLHDRMLFLRDFPMGPREKRRKLEKERNGERKRERDGEREKEKWRAHTFYSDDNFVTNLMYKSPS